MASINTSALLGTILVPIAVLLKGTVLDQLLPDRKDFPLGGLCTLNLRWSGHLRAARGEYEVVVRTKPAVRGQRAIHRDGSSFFER